MQGASPYNQQLLGGQRFQAVRPCMVGQFVDSSKVNARFADYFGYINSADPTNCFIGDSAIVTDLKLYNVGNDDYDPVGLENRKVVIEFTEGLTETAQFQLVIQTYLESVTADFLKRIQTLLDYSIAAIVGIYHPTITTTMRVRPIIAPYDTSTLTWNDFISSPPIFGATQEFIIESNSLNIGTSAIATISGSLEYDKLFPAIITPSATSTTPIYGFVIDVKQAAAGSGIVFSNQIVRLSAIRVRSIYSVILE